jgi:hypothetical protein
MRLMTLTPTLTLTLMMVRAMVVCSQVQAVLQQLHGLPL